MEGLVKQDRRCSGVERCCGLSPLFTRALTVLSKTIRLRPNKVLLLSNYSSNLSILSFLTSVWLQENLCLACNIVWG